MIVALDLSLTATGYACSDGRRGVLSPPKGVDRGMLRLSWIRNSVAEIVRGAEFVVVEGYAFGAKGSALFNIAEMGGVVRFTLWELGHQVVEVPPASLKLFATGRGNAKKDEVLAAAIRKLGFDGFDHNVADAMWLLEMAKTQFNGDASNDGQRRALEKIRWPSLTPA